MRNAELKEKELIATVEKPAEAEAFRIRTSPQAEAQRTQLQAEATATGQGIALQRMLVEKMPEIIAAAASSWPTPTSLSSTAPTAWASFSPAWPVRRPS